MSKSRKLKVWNARIMAVDRAASPDYAAIDRRIASSFNITTDTLKCIRIQGQLEWWPMPPLP